MSVSRYVREGATTSSWIRRMFEQGKSLRRLFGEENVFDLSLGNPIVEPPPEVLEELARLASSPTPGMHRYMPNAGFHETREAVADQLRLDTGIPYTYQDIVMTCGAAAAFNVALKTVMDPGDEVILFAPYFVEYLHYVQAQQGIARILPTDDEFLPRLDLLEAAISPRTRVVVLNSPNNPSGALYDDDLLENLAILLRRKSQEIGHTIYVVSDEPYRRIVYDGASFAFPARHYDETIVLNSHSKDLALPGERIGYLAVHPRSQERAALIEGCTFCNRTLGFVNAPALMQRLVAKFQNLSVDVAHYQRKRDVLYRELTALGLQMRKPRGTFYLFPRSPIPDDVAFVRALTERRVLVVPGTGFGRPGYFRIAFCVDDRTIEGAIDGFRKVMPQFQPFIQEPERTRLHAGVAV